jgi:hypothetical protein
MRKRDVLRRSQRRRQRWMNQGHLGSQLFRFGMALAIVVVLGIAAMEVLDVRGSVASPPTRTEVAGSTETASQTVAERARVEVLATLPHDRGAFTQGLLLFEGGCTRAQDSLAHLPFAWWTSRAG